MQKEKKVKSSLRFCFKDSLIKTIDIQKNNNNNKKDYKEHGFNHYVSSRRKLCSCSGKTNIKQQSSEFHFFQFWAEESFSTTELKAVLSYSGFSCVEPSFSLIHYSVRLKPFDELLYPSVLSFAN